jgi:hypothetical protein
MNDTRTFRGLGQHGPAPTPEERTRTLRGVGLTPNTLTGLGSPQASSAPTNPCACCRVKADAVSPDVAACLGVAMVVLHGDAEAKGALCVMHARLVHLLVDEMRHPGRRDSGSWDD